MGSFPHLRSHLWVKILRRSGDSHRDIQTLTAGNLKYISELNQNRKGSFLFLTRLEFGQGMQLLLIAAFIIYEGHYTDQQLYSISNRLIKRDTRLFNSLVFNLVIFHFCQSQYTHTYTIFNTPHNNYIMDKFLNTKKRSSSTNIDTGETGPSAEIPNLDIECSATATGPSSLKTMKNDEAPADISQSANGNPIQPRLREYPQHREGNSHARSFVGAWFDDYKWAEYSQERDAMFCFACRHFMPPTYGKAEGAFTKTGFRRWKKARGTNGVIPKHENSQCHKLSYVAWMDYQRNVSEKTSVAQTISLAHQKKVRENRHFIRTIAEIVLLTMSQNIAQRGHRESDDNLNPGNVRKILKFSAKHDAIIADRIKDGPKNEKYTSPLIQNEIITILASMVREEIAENIRSSKYFSVQADEANDVRRTQQLSLVLRFFNETSCSIEECFISFTPLPELDASAITDCIINTLERLGLDFKSSLIGLGFDGASVMRGQITGVQKRIRDRAPFAHYVHCYGHRLNLVLINSVKHIPGAADFFSLLENLYVFVSNPAVHKRFVGIQQEMFPNEKVRELQHLSDTRWWCRATSCENALLRLEAIIKLLEETSANDVGARAISARGLHSQIDAEFVHLLRFFSDILEKVNKVSKQLQDQQTDLGKAAQLISSLREDLVDIRNSNLTDVYADSISELCNKCNIPLTTLCKRRKPKHFEESIVFECTGQRPAASSPSGRLINSYYPILDCLISELDNRFSNESAVIFRGISALCPGGQTFLSTHDLKKLCYCLLSQCS